MTIELRCFRAVVELQNSYIPFFRFRHTAVRICFCIYYKQTRVGQQITKQSNPMQIYTT
jgi:hypothetical protein